MQIKFLSQEEIQEVRGNGLRGVNRPSVMKAPLPAITGINKVVFQDFLHFVLMYKIL